eukprot:CAMPEP_0196746966 /NCGR_PEP_ID=MMETSP1091-20130531/67769_1 /TAXON_ID=302021 /ORGANISM="Rhodomonas sp., Strain CCMP768" /LENGTH=59 /DNA_ID=CAMNT_0042094019 /DNA_START=9 /DNA_END=188 /DNA_ORIENTATION=+
MPPPARQIAALKPLPSQPFFARPFPSQADVQLGQPTAGPTYHAGLAVGGGEQPKIPTRA